VSRCNLQFNISAYRTNWKSIVKEVVPVLLSRVFDYLLAGALADYR